MHVLILTEGSSQIGFGHITRCISLYQAFELFGVEPFMVVKGDESSKTVLDGLNYEVFDWQEGWKAFRDRLKDFKVVIVDSYLAPKELYEDISDLRLSLYIDDYKRLDYPKGIVLNGSVYAKELEYPKRKGVIYLLGSGYIPLRRAFWKGPTLKIRKRLRRLLITFGGDDSRNMTPKVTEFVRKNFPSLELFVVIGGGFKNREEILALGESKVKVFERLKAEEMKALMLEVDLCISAGGQTTYELARVGVPSILVAVAENQLLNCQGWQKAGFAKYAGWWEDRELFERLGRYTEEFMNHEERLKASKVGKGLVDGRGALRVAKFLLKAYKGL